MGLEVVAPMAVYAVLEFSWKIRTLKTSPANSIGKYIQAQPERELGDLPEFTELSLDGSTSKLNPQWGVWGPSSDTGGHPAGGSEASTPQPHGASKPAHCVKRNSMQRRSTSTLTWQQGVVGTFQNYEKGRGDDALTSENFWHHTHRRHRVSNTLCVK